MKAIDYKKVEHSTKVEDCPGLYVLVSKSKTGKLSRSFAFRITVKGEAHKLTLGSVEKVTLADAKQQAKTLSSKITLGYNVKDLFLKFRGYNPTISGIEDHHRTVWTNEKRHCCKVSDEAAFCLIQRPYISKTLLTRRISPRGSP